MVAQYDIVLDDFFNACFVGVVRIEGDQAKQKHKNTL